MDRPPLFAARRIAGIYTLLGALWIIVSDRLLGMMVPDPHTLTLIQTYKGWAFVLASGLLIFLVLSRELRGRLEDEKLLRESEQRYHSLFDNMLDGFAYCKMFFEDGKPQDFIYLDVNDSFERLTGLKNVIGKKVTEVIPGIRESNPELFEIYGRVALTGSPERFETYVDSLGIWFSISVYSSEREHFTAVFDNITDRQRAEEALRESEERLRLVTETVEDVFWMTTPGIQEMAYVSPSYERIWGRTRDSLYESPKSFLESVHPEDRERLLRAIQEPQERAWACEYRIVRPDGTIRWIHDRGYPILDESGDLRLRTGISTDITDRKKAEEELRESERKYRDLFDGAPVGIFQSTIDGRVLSVNPAYAHMYGHASAEQAAQGIDNVAERIYVEPERRKKLIDLALRTDGFVKAENQYRKRDGSLFWGQLYFQVVRDRDGEVKHLEGFVEDITDRKRAEESLRNLLDFRQTLIDAIPNPVFYKDVDGKYIGCNEAFAALVGVPKEEVVGRSVYEVAPQDLANLWREKDQELFDEPHVQIFECILARPDGTERSLVFHKAPIFGPDGRLAGLIGVVMDITDRLRAEKALRFEKQKFETLCENAPFAMVMIAEDGTFQYANPKFKELFGYDLSEVPNGRSWFRKAFPNDAYRDEVITTWMTDLNVSKPGEQRPRIFSATCKDGTEKIIHFRPVQLEIGVHLVSFEDITHRTKAEEDLRNSEERYRAIFNNAPIGIVLADSDGRFKEANSALSKMLGYTPEELQRRTTRDVTHPEDIEISAENLDRLTRGECESYRLEKRFLRNDGSLIWADLSVAALHNPLGKHDATVGMISDITSRKRSEAVQKRLATAVGQAAEAIVITDPQGTIQYVNPAAERISGYKREEVLGKTTSVFKSGEHDQAFYTNLWETIKRGEVWTGRFINKRKDGSLCHEEATISPVRGSGGETINFVAVKRDITEHLELSRQLLQAQKMEAIGTLAGGIAHDFNNLLQVTLGYSELLLTGKRQDDPEYADLSKIFQAARSGAELVQRLLMFSRKADFKPIPLNLNRSIAQVDKLLRRTIPKMIDIQLDLSDDLAEINADQTQMEQVLMNLAVNARDAMPDGGKFTVGTKKVTLDEECCRIHTEARPGEYVLLTVSDTGHGIDKAIIDHIFEPFYTTKELGRGTGLGLAMVYGIVKQYGGFINCYSKVGRGTTFNVYFPVIESQMEPEVQSSGVMPAFGTETILLVDDEDFVRDLGARILSKAGYSVLTATNGKEALDLFEKEREQISLVILDLIMPEMGGKECLKELRKIDPKLKVLIATGLSADPFTKESVEMGTRGFVSKPFRIKELLRQVRRVLDGS